jgi:hypothetical protein
MQMGRGRNKFVDNLIRRVLCTGYGIYQFLSDRNLDAVPDMTMPANILLGTVRIPRFLLLYCSHRKRR